jgi:hypothetical protein
VVLSRASPAPVTWRVIYFYSFIFNTDIQGRFHPTEF